MSDLDELLRSTRPEAPSAQLSRATGAMAREIVTRSRPRQWTARRAALAGVTTLAVLVPVGSAAAGYLGAHTGRQVAELHAGDHSEALDGCAPDFAEVVTEYRPVGALLPAGLTWTAVDAEVARVPRADCAVGTPFPQTEAGVRAHYAFTLFEAWRWSFVRAAERGDDASMQICAGYLRELAGSAQMRRVVEDGSSTGVYSQLADAAVRGDVDFVRTRVPMSDETVYQAVR